MTYIVGTLVLAALNLSWGTTIIQKGKRIGWTNIVVGVVIGVQAMWHYLNI